MINPIIHVFEWWAQFNELVPVSIQAFVNLYLVVCVALAVVMLLWRSKH